MRLKNVSANSQNRGNLVIVGAGGHGRVCADVASTAGFTVAGFVDVGRKVSEEINGVVVIARHLAELQGQADFCMLIAIGMNAKRWSVLEEAEALGFKLATVIHPGATVSPSAKIRSGTVVMAGAVIAANARVGRACIINHGATVDHDNVLEDNVQICPGAHLAGGVHVGEAAFVGTGAIVIPGVKIAARAIIAAGAVVIRDVEVGRTVAGVPAQPIG